MNEKKNKKFNINNNVVNKTDSELEREAIQEENISIFMIFLIIGICSLVGISLGYFLFKIAINSSNAMILRSIIKMTL